MIELVSKLSGFFSRNSETFNIVFSLVIIFQFFDRRSRNKWQENTLVALKEMSGRIKSIGSNNKKAISGKAEDLISVINAAVKTVDGRNSRGRKSRIFWSFNWLKKNSDVSDK